MENQPLSAYISHIEETTDYVFFFNKEVDTNTRISLSVNGETIDSVLRKLFEKTDIEYSIKGNQISLKKKQASKPVSGKHTVSGIVTDSGSDETLIGVGIMIKGTTQGTITDEAGAYSIEVDQNATLVFSYVGFRDSEVLVGDLAILNVKMEPDNEIMSSVVVGAGVQKRISVTGSITSMVGDELKAPSSALTNNLAGQLAGVISVTTSGEPGSTSSFYIRGINTFGARSTPLSMLDGVEI